MSNIKYHECETITENVTIRKWKDDGFWQMETEGECCFSGQFEGHIAKNICFCPYCGSKLENV